MLRRNEAQPADSGNARGGKSQDALLYDPEKMAQSIRDKFRERYLELAEAQKPKTIADSYNSSQGIGSHDAASQSQGSQGNGGMSKSVKQQSNMVSSAPKYSNFKQLSNLLK